MSLDRLGQQIDDAVRWRRALAAVLVRYRSWLVDNRLTSAALDRRLEHALRMLRSERLTLAVVGEFSRGKTELINALFFAELGRRVLPSQPGRTTMCPTELFFDPQASRPYLCLLPIETRLTDTPLAELRLRREAWVTFNLDIGNPAAMAEAFAEVARIKAVSREQALRLGFDPAALEPAAEPDRVRVPAWRHALASLDHPLLRKGLRVLDTPGLNALGSEPELTLSLLPEAQVVFFLLAADCGVTASDLAIWEQHVRGLDREGPRRLYALLNKIDTLEDELLEPGEIAADQARLCQASAARLGLPSEQVLPLSARQGLLARIRGDDALLARSRFAELEQLLGERLVNDRARLIDEQVVAPLREMLQASQALLRQRLERVHQQQRELAAREVDQEALLTELNERARAEHAAHHKQQLALRGQQNLLRRQAERLRQIIAPERQELHLQAVRQRLLGSWTTLGINQGIVRFFEMLEADLQHLGNEAALADRTVAAIYRRHNEANPLDAMDPPVLDLGPFRQQLARLRQHADRFRLQPSTLLSEQHALARRFLATLAQSALELHGRLRLAIEHWENEALLPLQQLHQQQRQLLDQQVLELRTLAQAGLRDRTRHQLLGRYAEQLQHQRAEVGSLLRRLQQCQPPRSGNVPHARSPAREGATGASMV